MNYINYNQFITDCYKLAKRIPHEYHCIIGIPRSGYIPAAIIAEHLNLPMYTVWEYVNQTFAEKSSRIKLNDKKKVLLVDDSIGSGKTIQKNKEMIKDIEIDTAVVYTDLNGKHDITFVQREIKSPRAFQWNILNHGHLATAGLDFDGVLCKDPEFYEDDSKPEQMRDFFLNAIPLHIPQQKIFAIISNRLEKYRFEIEIWLAKYNIQYEHLILVPYNTAIERRNDYKRRGGNGFWKAEKAKELNCKWFVESNPQQAKEIQSQGVKCFCTETMNFI